LKYGLPTPSLRGRFFTKSDQDRQIAQSLLADPAIPIAEIAKRLNVSKQTFYRHFPGGRSAGEVDPKLTG
jgi:DNA invertase Pin-like site-specific DNA recombinase